MYPSCTIYHANGSAIDKQSMLDFNPVKVGFEYYSQIDTSDRRDPNTFTVGCTLAGSRVDLDLGPILTQSLFLNSPQLTKALPFPQHLLRPQRLTFLVLNFFGLGPTCPRTLDLDPMSTFEDLDLHPRDIKSEEDDQLYH